MARWDKEDTSTIPDWFWKPLIHPQRVVLLKWTNAMWRTVFIPRPVSPACF